MATIVYPSNEDKIREKIQEGNTNPINVAQGLLAKKAIKMGINSGETLRGPRIEYPSNQGNIERLIQTDKNFEDAYGYRPVTIDKKEKSKVSIVDIDAKDSDDHVDLVWIPKILTYKPESKLVALVSSGRNNPFYHYGGSEDTLEFTIDWFFTDDHTRQEALKRARWLESLSKADGYLGPLHRVQLIWGSSGLFDDYLFLVETAHYQMSQWVDYGYDKVAGKAINPETNRFNNLKKYGLLPTQITQEIVLKRVTEYNLNTADIKFNNNNTLV